MNFEGFKQLCEVMNIFENEKEQEEIFQEIARKNQSFTFDDFDLFIKKKMEKTI